MPDCLDSVWLKKRLIPWYCDTEWGRVSLVLAELLLLKAALRDKANQFFLLHSESCVPMRSFDFIYEQIVRTNQSWLHYHKGNMDRYGGVNKNKICQDQFYKASQFFCLRRNHAELLLKNVDLGNWQESWFADEHCIPTTLAHCGRLNECVRHDLTFSYWPTPARSPMTFDVLKKEDLVVLGKTVTMFARKFSVKSNIMNYVPLPCPQ